MHFNTNFANVYYVVFNTNFVWNFNVYFFKYLFIKNDQRFLINEKSSLAIFTILNNRELLLHYEENFFKLF